MNTAKVVTGLAVLVMGGVLIYAFAVGNFNEEGKTLLSLPWGIVSLVDLYVGFTLFAGWIIYREKSAVRSVIWVALLLIFGFFIGSLYALVALLTSKGNWHRFWLGRRWELY